MISSTALAAGGRVAVLAFSGTGAEVAERAIVNALPSGYQLIPLDDVDKATARVTKTDLRSDDEYAQVARLLDAVAIVDGRVATAGNEVGLRLGVRNGAGKTVGTMVFRAASYKALVVSLKRKGTPALATLLGRTNPGGKAVAVAQGRDAEETPAEDAESAALAESASDVDPGDRPPFVEIAMGPRVLTRTLAFTDNLAGIPGYSLKGAPAILASGEIYPAARSSSGASRIGFAGEIESSVGAKTAGEDGLTSYPTTIRAYRVGARYREVGETSFATFGADYGEHSFELEVPNVIAPNVKYTFLRPVARGSMMVASGWTLGLEVAYLHVLSIGGMGDEEMFPRMTAMGAEVRTSLGYRIDADFAIELVADLRHYAHKMNVQPGDELIVGGAVDEHFGAALLATYRVR